MLFWQWGLCSVALPISSCFLGDFLPSFPECNLTSWSSEDSHPTSPDIHVVIYFEPEYDHCLLFSQTDWLTDQLTDCCFVDLIDVTMACEDAYSKLLLLLMIVMRIVLARVCCRFGNWGLVIKLYFCSDFEYFSRDFEVEVQVRFWSWS